MLGDASAEASSSRAPRQRLAHGRRARGAGPTPPAAVYLVSSSHEHRLNLGRVIPTGMHSMLAGMGAGLVSSIATCPLDVVKTTLQAQSAPRGDPGYEGVTKTCLRIYRQNGLKGFYRGLGPTIAGYLPTWGIYFTVYDFVKDKMKHNRRMMNHPDIAHIISAMLAGASGTIITNPLWVVKTRFMAQAILPPDAPKYRSTLDGFRTIYRNEGLAAFYKGLIPSLFGISHVAVQFTLYEKAKAWAAHGSHDPLTPSAILLCSALSKMIASLATYPHEVLRTRIQMQKKPRQLPKPAPPAAEHGSRGHLYSPLLAGSQPPVPAEEAAAAAAAKAGRPLPSTPSARSTIAAPAHPTWIRSPAPPPSSAPAPAAAARSSTAHVPTAGGAGRAEPALAGPGELDNGRATRVSAPGELARRAEAQLTEATREARANTLRPASTEAGKRTWPRKGGIIDVFVRIYRQDGWRGFYRGLSINLVRTVPASAVTMLTYELIMRNLSAGAAAAAPAAGTGGRGAAGDDCGEVA